MVAYDSGYPLDNKGYSVITTDILGLQAEVVPAQGILTTHWYSTQRKKQNMVTRAIW
jgi:hypothetical protein